LSNTRLSKSLNLIMLSTYTTLHEKKVFEIRLDKIKGKKYKMDAQ